MPIAIQRVPHVLVELPAVQARLEHARIEPQHFFARVAGDPGEGVVHFEDLSRAIGDGDSFARAGKHRGAQAQPVVGRPSLGHILCEQDDSAHGAVARPPGDNLPSAPFHSAVRALEPVFVDAHTLPCQCRVGAPSFHRSGMSGTTS